ncbi:Metallo-peptidase family M12-domain-containing protein [Sporodiniella umbellata]|nr:Metallo-peptidase family M12-domain-containing protein [Sporodiniella umbellata]
MLVFIIIAENFKSVPLDADTESKIAGCLFYILPLALNTLVLSRSAGTHKRLLFSSIILNKLDEIANHNRQLPQARLRPSVYSKLIDTLYMYCLNNNRIGQAEGLSDIHLRRDLNGNVILEIYAFNTTYQLELEPNSDLFHPHTAVDPSWPIAYRGHVTVADPFQGFRTKLGWARLTIDEKMNQPISIQGSFKVNEAMYHIKSQEVYRRVKRASDPEIAQPIVIYQDSNRMDREEIGHHQCGVDGLGTVDMTPQIGLAKRSEGCPRTRKTADCTYVRHYKSQETARIQIMNNFNTASALFEETFNISLGLIDITLLEKTCPTQLDPARSWNRACEATYSLYDRLSDFSLWRNQKGKDGAGLWHLMTNCPLDSVGLEVGLAWLGQVCHSGLARQEDEVGTLRYVSGTSISSITRDEWKIVAHEVGHSFGAVHDCNGQSCPCASGKCSCCPLSEKTCDADGSFIMNPTSNSSVERFSPCSVKTVCSLYPTLATCLSDPQDRLQNLFALNTCGNGIREEGEECDTGGKQSACCDPKTCRLINNAVCEDSNEGCCHECQLRPNTHVCRPSLSSCDESEYCTGHSALCPQDAHVPDGTGCSTDGLTCASGQCTSRDQQCMARGLKMNITSACSVRREECKMLCEFPGDPDKCTLFSSNFLDGTLCGENGTCANGLCEQPSEIKDKHVVPSVSPVILATLISLASVILLSVLGSWLWLRNKKKENKKSQIQNASSMTLVEGRLIK